MEDPRSVLNEVNTGIKMGMDSISTISEKVSDQNFKDDLQYMYNQYNNILNRVNQELENYGDLPDELNPMQKAMGWTEIQMSTIQDKSNSHLSELLLKGTNMGITTGVKLLNQNPQLDENTKNILKDFIKYQENTVEKLKTYL